MAKMDMICPFSGELCRECPQYRGRHYYLCFVKKYRGYLGSADNTRTQKPDRLKAIVPHAVKDFFRLPIPPPLAPRSSWLVFSDYLGRTDK